jgi:plastocyanin
MMGRIGMMLALAAWAGAATAGGLEVSVVDAGGKPVADAVVMLHATSGQPLPPVASPSLRYVDQRSLVFLPYLQVVRPGDQVVFRNSDNTRHHVYSFSPARTFEFVLVPAQKSPPLRLDRTGAIAVGCNIHDQMIAYLYVTDAPWFAQTGTTGKVAFNELPAGEYDVEAWQPRLRPGKPPPPRRMTVGAGGQATALTIPMRLLPDPRLQVGREHVHY